MTRTSTLQTLKKASQLLEKVEPGQPEVINVPSETENDEDSLDDLVSEKLSSEEDSRILDDEDEADLDEESQKDRGSCLNDRDMRMLEKIHNEDGLGQVSTTDLTTLYEQYESSVHRNFSERIRLFKEKQKQLIQVAYAES